MPLEIRELHIKAIVENPSDSSGSPQTSGETNNNEDPSERLIRACVERVLELIKEAKER